MEIIVDLLKITLPAALVLYLAYSLVKTFLDKQLEAVKIQKRLDLGKETLPLRLQAYERISLLLERIAPNNLIIRLNDGSYSVIEFQQILLREIREEFNHNLSQQIYMSDEAWNLVRQSVEEVIAVINNAAHELDKDAPAIKLAKKIFEQVLERDEDINMKALRHVKQEVRLLLI